jgi:glycine dehydrogenase subunit 1
VAELCIWAHAAKITGIPGYSLWSKEPFFNEFVVHCPAPVHEINEYLLDEGILGGYDLGQDHPELKNHMLVAVTEMNSKADIDFLVDLLTEQETLEVSDD